MGNMTVELDIEGGVWGMRKRCPSTVCSRRLIDGKTRIAPGRAKRGARPRSSMVLARARRKMWAARLGTTRS